MGAVAHQTGFGLEGADHTGAQILDGGGQADHTVVVGRIGRTAEATSAREKMAPPWATPMPFLWFSVMGMVTRAYSRLTSSMHISR